MRRFETSAYACAAAMGGAVLAALSGAGVVETAHAATMFPTATQLLMTSGNGDPVGNGGRFALTAQTASLNAGGGTNGFGLSAWHNPSSYFVNLNAPSGQSLATGTYTGATTYPTAGHPELQVSVGGTMCNVASASFTVKSVSQDSQGNITSLDATFQQACPNSAGAVLSGEVMDNVPLSVHVSSPSPQQVSAGQAAVLVARVDSGGGAVATGTVTFSDDSGTIAVARVDGQGRAVVAEVMPAGTHVITAAYGGDATHPAATSNAYVETVTPTTATDSFSYASAPGDPVGQGASQSFGGPLNMYYSVGWFDVIESNSYPAWGAVFGAAAGQQLQPGTYTGVQAWAQPPPGAPNLSVNHGGGPNCSTVYGSFTITDLDSTPYGGVDQAGATFEQHCNDPSAPALTGSVSYHVPPLGRTSVTLSAAHTTVAGSHPVQLTATATSPSGGIGGSITFYDGVVPLGSAAVDATGTATLATAPLNGGVHNLTASYPGDSVNRPMTSPVVTVTASGRGQTATLITASTSSDMFGQPVTFTADVYDAAASPTGTVTFNDGVTQLGTATVADDGTATLTTTALGKGAHQVTAAYSGDGTSLASTSAPASVGVSVTTTTVVTADRTQVDPGQQVTLTATVTGQQGTPGGTVTFRISYGGPFATVALDSSGTATLTVTAQLGCNGYEADYSGDTYDASSWNAVQVCAGHPTSTTLSASPTDAVDGQTIHLVATVTSGGGTPTGPVSFQSSAAGSLGSAPLDSTGTATLDVHLWSAYHQITAVYGGVGTYLSSQSQPVWVQVRHAVSVTASALPITPMTVPTLLQASVTSSYGVPTGVVAFVDTYGTTVCTATLDSKGNASCLGSFSTPGPDTVVAQYLGDLTYHPGDSAGVPITVLGATTTTLLH